MKAVQNAFLKNVDAADDEKDGEPESQLFGNLEIGQEVTVVKCIPVKKTTTPPKLHTEATLLTAMENAGASITDNEGYRQILKGHGIGTQATRAEIIKKLFDVNYVTNVKKGKVNYIVPTKKGYNATRVFPAELLSPTLTAEWETMIAKVAEGTYSEKQFMEEFEIFMVRTIEKYKNITVDEGNFDFDDREALGACLWCGESVVFSCFKDKKTGEKKECYYCTNKDCRFSVYKNDRFFMKRTGKPLSDNNVRNLLKNKSLTVQCVNRNGVEYMTKFTIVR